MNGRNGTSGGISRLPSGIWILGFVSMLMDMSSELMLSLLPVYMTTLLGAGMISVGIVEGFSEAAASVMKIFSGIWSDRLRRRKPLALAGYGLSALTKPLFPLAGSVGMLFLARFLDRVGKGIRGAPRDALIAELTPSGMHGAAFGLRQALDSAGAFLGPLLAVLLMLLLSGDIRLVLWIATIPAVACILMLSAGLREPPVPDAPKVSGHTPSLRAGFERLPVSFWLIVTTGALFTMARFTDAFLVLRALNTGLAASFVPLVFVVMNVVYAAVSYPVGALSDRYGDAVQLTIGIGLLVAANLVLAAAAQPLVVMAGVVLWGAHLGFTQGVLSKLVALNAPQELKATGFGIFNLVTGLAILLSSLIAGSLWQLVGPSSTFLAGAIFATIASVGLAVAARSGALSERG